MKTVHKIVSKDTLKEKIAALRRKGKRIVFTNGCFDILHAGHVSYLEEAKKDNKRILIIGLNSDGSVRSLEKGLGRPIVPQKERAKLLAALSCVDFVVIFNESTPEKLIKFLSPDILIKGADWKGKKVAGSEFVKKVDFIRYIKGLSTTNIIEKIRKG
ncbi:MAG: adenylyltransferase/cytidyltransferase family protein [Candidatus Omnitrophica bacterium]|nr:adenylyltransferase/cytidyltransferase family protein [Candidatus Omnitrophota bacterium]